MDGEDIIMFLDAQPLNRASFLCFLTNLKLSTRIRVASKAERRARLAGSEISLNNLSGTLPIVLFALQSWGLIEVVAICFAWLGAFCLALPEQSRLEGACRALFGVTCEPENPDALAHAVIDHSRKTKIELGSMGRSGKIFYYNQLSLSVVVFHFENIFRKILG